MCKLSKEDIFPSAVSSFSPSCMAMEVFIVLIRLSNGDFPIPSSLVLNFRSYSCFFLCGSPKYSSGLQAWNLILHVDCPTLSPYWSITQDTRNTPVVTIFVSSEGNKCKVVY